jgi:hypothetical protein
LIIQAIGDAQQFWVYGTEEAFTIVPNFLVTGLLALLVSLAIIVWCAGYVHKKHGSAIFILLFGLLFLVGGGIAQVVFFIPTWLVSRRIYHPLTWWRRVLPEKSRGMIGKLWPYSLAMGGAAFLVALEIAIFGYVPGLGSGDAETALAICWSLLLGALILFIVTFISGFAYDIQAQKG